MPHSISIDAPAKVNLYLKILNKRSDGYHDIQTVFERIDLADRIRIEKAPRGIEVSSNIPIVRRPADNLAYRAAKLVLSRAKPVCGVKIHIDKNIPLAAGLGGGSSDAASVLIGMNSLLRLGLSKKILESIGRELGADVPFFLSEAAFAIGTKRGDVIKPVGIKRIFYHILIYPNYRLETKRVYKAFDCLEPGSLRRPKGLTKALSGDKIDTASLAGRFIAGDPEALHNDLEEAAIKVRKDIEGIIERLAGLAGTRVIVSGSGPSVFCLLKNRKEAIGAKRRVLSGIPPRQRRGWKIFVVRTLQKRRSISAWRSLK